MNDSEKLFRSALAFAIENPYSDFYRRKYGVENKELLARSMTDIPFLVRSEIDAVPMRERTFVPPQLVHFIRSTSGSTGKQVIGFPMLEEGEFQEHLKTLSYVRASGQNSRYFEPYFTAMGIRSILLFSAGAFVHETRLRELEGRQMISGEFAEPRLTASLATAAACEAIIGNPSGLVDFAPHLVEAGGAQVVRLIISVGERPTSLQLSALAQAFPNAKIALQYGLTESQGYVGFSCPERLASDPKALHLASGTFIMEIVNPETLAPLALSDGAEGELVVTSHEPQGFPLIRYRTGDLVRIRPERCGCAGSPLLFECLGRVNLDRIRIPRGVLTIAAIDAAIASLNLPLSEFSVRWNAEGEPPGIILTFYTEEQSLADKLIPEDVASRIAIAPSVTYQDIAASELAAQIVIEVRAPASWIGWRKKRRLS